MRTLTILFVLVLAISACKKTKEENSNTSTLKVMLTSPVDGATVQTGSEVRFTWFSSSSDNSVQIMHKIKIVEITGDQSPEQAYRSNKPHFEKDSLKELLLVLPYSPASPGLVLGKKYAWGVTATQKGLTSTGGESKLSMFTAIR